MTFFQGWGLISCGFVWLGGTLILGKPFAEAFTLPIGILAMVIATIDILLDEKEEAGL